MRNGLSTAFFIRGNRDVVRDLTDLLKEAHQMHLDECVYRIDSIGRAGNTGLSTACFNRGNRDVVRDLIDLLKEAHRLCLSESQLLA